MNNRTIKLVAVAKDEAPYLSDWIFHHLHFGFDHIEIYINRTSDNSIAILDKIKENHPNVDYQFADWVDYLPPRSRIHLQQICYMHAIGHSTDFEYVMFLDIDEFWLCKDFRTTIQDFLKQMENRSWESIFFEWFLEDALEKEFSPMQQTTRGKLDRLGKYLTRLPASFEYIRLHVPKYENPNNVLLADGTSFCLPGSRSDQQDVPKEKSSLKDYFVLHRLYRSDVEYLASLYKGNPQLDFPIKLNRFGLGFERNDKNIVDMAFPLKDFAIYQKRREEFIVNNDVQNLIAESQNKISGIASELADVIQDCRKKKPEEVKRVLQRTSLEIPGDKPETHVESKKKKLSQMATQSWRRIRKSIVP